MSVKTIWKRLEKICPPNKDIEVRVSYDGKPLPEPLPGQRTFDIYCDYGGDSDEAV